MAGLERTAPGDIEEVWRPEGLSGVRLGFAPFENLPFALGFACWTGV